MITTSHHQKIIRDSTTIMAMDNSTDMSDLEIFKKLEEYPWDTDREFQGGLSAILGPSPIPSQIPDLTLRAQCFYLSRKLSIPIDFTNYKTYLSTKSPPIPTTNPPSQTSPPTTTTTTTTATTTTTSSPPTSTSYPSTPIQPPTPPPTLSTVTPSSPSNLLPSNDPFSTLPTSSLATSTQTDGAPYPPTFAQIVQLITAGSPIPGIKEIPPTLLTGQESQAVLPKRRKPWEKDVTEEGGDTGLGGTFGDRRDDYIVQELPVEDGEVDRV